MTDEERREEADEEERGGGRGGARRGEENKKREEKEIRRPSVLGAVAVGIGTLFGGGGSGLQPYCETSATWPSCVRSWCILHPVPHQASKMSRLFPDVVPRKAWKRTIWITTMSVSMASH